MTYFALVPAYNEEKNIVEVLSRLKKIKDLKIIVVDDGSVDKTPHLVKKLGHILIRHEKNRGKGEAINTGFKHILKNYPRAKYVVIIDADLQYKPEDANRVLESLEKDDADIVTGFRELKDIPDANRIGNFIWRTLFNIFFGTHFKDTNCGLMAFTIDAIKRIKKIQGGYIIENSILAQAVEAGLRVKQISVHVSYGKRNIKKFARMFFGVLFFIVREGLKYRLSKK